MRDVGRDERGRFRAFEGGAMYWADETDALAVSGRKVATPGSATAAVPPRWDIRRRLGGRFPVEGRPAFSAPPSPR